MIRASTAEFVPVEFAGAGRLLASRLAALAARTEEMVPELGLDASVHIEYVSFVVNMDQWDHYESIPILPDTDQA